MQLKLFTTTLALAALTLTSLSAESSSLAFEFNTPGDTEGWNGVNITNLTTETSQVQGSEGVLTSEALPNTDPRLIYGSDMILSPGDVWDSIEIRWRQLDGNPADVGTAPLSAYYVNGRLIYVNSGAGPGFYNLYDHTSEITDGSTLDGDKFTISTTPTDTNGWLLQTVSLADAPTFASNDIQYFRFDPVGGNADYNFEVDYIRINAIPEPSAFALLSGLLALSWIMLRRRL